MSYSSIVCALLWAIWNTAMTLILINQKQIKSFIVFAGDHFCYALDAYVVLSVGRGTTLGYEFWVQRLELVAHDLYNRCGSRLDNMIPC